jgi:hypothetical protein
MSDEDMGRLNVRRREQCAETAHGLSRRERRIGP